MPIAGARRPVAAPAVNAIVPCSRARAKAPDEAPASPASDTPSSAPTGAASVHGRRARTNTDQKPSATAWLSTISMSVNPASVSWDR